MTPIVITDDQKTFLSGVISRLDQHASSGAINQSLPDFLTEMGYEKYTGDFYRIANGAAVSVLNLVTQAGQVFLGLRRPHRPEETETHLAAMMPSEEDYAYANDGQSYASASEADKRTFLLLYMGQFSVDQLNIVLKRSGLQLGLYAANNSFDVTRPGHLGCVYAIEQKKEVMHHALASLGKFTEERVRLLLGMTAPSRPGPRPHLHAVPHPRHVN